METGDVICRLAEAYGNPPPRPPRPPASELVYTMLSQNTSDVNSKRAFDQLMKTFGSLEELAAASEEKIAQAIRLGGLAKVKAPRIKAALDRILRERGSLDISFLGEMPILEAKAWLRRLPGVGPKTAACVLLFSLGRPVLPVDTHVHRVGRRLGLISQKTSAERAHEVLEAMLLPNEIYSFHVNMVRHGREVCHAQRPLCHVCILRSGCISARQ
ncbi:MAG: endonuclease III [Chloroflexota bacterium]